MNPNHHRKREHAPDLSEHIIFKATGHFFKPEMISSMIKTLLQEQSVKFHIKIYHFSINSNHIHMVVKAKSKESVHGFLRSVSGTISLRVRKLLNLSSDVVVWLQRPFSRIVHWGKDFKNIINYIAMNYLESIGWLREKIELSNLLEVINAGKTRLFENQTRQKSAQLEFDLT